jgi:hypothetical protein
MTAAVKPRALRPKLTAETPIVPATVSDLSCAAVLGLEPRQYKELVIREGVRHARIGHRVVVRLDVILAVLDRLAEGGDAVAEVPAKRAPTGNRVLALIGRERAS